MGGGASLFLFRPRLWNHPRRAILAYHADAELVSLGQCTHGVHLRIRRALSFRYNGQHSVLSNSPPTTTVGERSTSGLLRRQDHENATISDTAGAAGLGHTAVVRGSD